MTIPFKGERHMAIHAISFTENSPVCERVNVQDNIINRDNKLPTVNIKCKQKHN